MNKLIKEIKSCAPHIECATKDAGGNSIWGQESVLDDFDAKQIADKCYKEAVKAVANVLDAKNSFKAHAALRKAFALDNERGEPSCNSISDCQGGDYCKRCSHAIYYGEVLVSGRRWSFEFNPRFGAVFTKADGEPKQVQPSEKSPVWGEFKKWHDREFKTGESE